jgi:hypothetical protein
MLNIMRRAVQIAEFGNEEVHMEGRIARVESDVAHIQTDVAAMKSDIRDLRGKTEAGFTEVRQSIAQLSVAMEKAYGKLSVATIETRVWRLVTLGGILLLVARAFKWI